MTAFDPIIQFIADGNVMSPDERRRILNMIVGIPLGLFLSSAILFAYAYWIGQ